MTKRLLVFLIIISCLAQLSLLFADEPERPRILILNSYHHGFAWTDTIVSGIRSVIPENSAEFLIEYMDTKRFPLTPPREISLRAEYAKYAEYIPDIIITSDNNALNFLAEFKKELFPDVPVVFCGYNSRNPLTGNIASLHQSGDLTGIVEYPRLQPTLELIRGLQPEVDRIYIIADNTETGRSNLAIIQETILEQQNSFQFLVLHANEFYLSDMLDLLSGLPETAAVFYLDFFKDRGGQYFTPGAILPQFSRVSSVPIYTHTDLYMDYGVLGGDLNRGFDHGRLAGETAMRILEGTVPGEIPLVMESPTSVVLDHAAFTRFQLDEKNVPVDTLFINRPFSFYETYSSLIWIIILIFLLLLSAVIFLTMYLLFKRRADRDLREQERKFRSVFESVRESIVIYDLENRKIADCNANFCRMFKLDKAAAMGKPIASIGQFAQRFTEDSKADSGEWFVRYNDGDDFWMEYSLSKIDVNDRRYVVFTGRDITEMKNHRLEMEQSLEEKQVLLQEVHHRVKNNFQIINSLLSLQESSAGEALLPLLREPRLRIQSLALVHDHLYSTADLVHIGFENYLNDLVAYITAAFLDGERNIEVQVSAETGVYLDMDRAVPCGLIINELLTNALKYAFPAGFSGTPRVTIEIGRQENLVTLTVRDNGIGMPDLDHDPAGTSHLGLSIVRSLVQQLYGTVRFTSAEGMETRIEFPLPDKAEPHTP